MEAQRKRPRRLLLRSNPSLRDATPSQTLAKLHVSLREANCTRSRLDVTETSLIGDGSTP